VSTALVTSQLTLCISTMKRNMRNSCHSENDKHIIYHTGISSLSSSQGVLSLQWTTHVAHCESLVLPHELPAVLLSLCTYKSITQSTEKLNTHTNDQRFTSFETEPKIKPSIFLQSQNTMALIRMFSKKTWIHANMQNDSTKKRNYLGYTWNIKQTSIITNYKVCRCLPLLLNYGYFRTWLNGHFYISIIGGTGLEGL